jgi:hypothetical protein
LTKTKAQLAIKGIAQIEKSKQEQLAKIEKQRLAALQALNIKYATADQIKTSFGYIGIISLSVLYGVILLNDLVKLIGFCIRELNELIEEKAKEKSLDNDNQDGDEDEANNDKLDNEYAEDLDEKLEKFHKTLVRAVAKNRSKQQINEYDP